MSRGNRPPLKQQSQALCSPTPSPLRNVTIQESLSRNTSLETRSRSPSPNPTPIGTSPYEYYGTSNLIDRSRSPSPSSLSEEGTHLLLRRQPATPQKPAALNLSVRQIDNMPHVLPSPTIPQPHRSPGSINFPRLSPSPSHEFYEIDWTRLPGRAVGSRTSTLPRSVSSQQLGRTWNGSITCIDRNRSHYPSQILHPYPNPRQGVSLLLDAHGNQQRIVGHQVEMEDITLQEAADAFGLRSGGQNTSALPRTFQLGKGPSRDQDWNALSSLKTGDMLCKEKEKDMQGDSEDEDWC